MYHTKIALPGVLSRCVVLCVAALLFSCAAHASIAVLLEEPYGPMGHVSPSGHTALYLDHVCADSPMRLRPCLPGELGVVISRYHGIGSRDWIAVPLLGYLYSVDQPQDIPLTVRRDDVALLRDKYRREHLEVVAPDNEDGTAPEGNWYELAGAAFDRTIYGFQVNSTEAQDLALIAFLNDSKNHSSYNGAFRNCADFVRTTVNRFYPHAIHRNYVADLGMTSPKSVAKELSHFGMRHPETGLFRFRIEQVSGDLPRSHPAVTLSEGVLKEFGLPLMIVTPVTAAVVAVSYVVSGRFKEPVDAPVLNLRTDLVLEGALNVNAVVPRAGGWNSGEALLTEDTNDQPQRLGEDQPKQ